MNVSLVFMGSPEEAAESLRALARAGAGIRAVVTRPDRPRGRGRRLAPPVVKEAAQQLGLECLQPENVNAPEFLETLRALRPDLVVVVAFGAILRPPLLELAPRGCLNLHFSLLPELRGAAPVEWAILRGYAETGVTTMYMNEEVDAGDVIFSRATPIGPDETAGELRRRLSALGADLLVETVRRFADGGEPPRTPQDASRKTRAPRILSETASIDWREPARAIHNRVRALHPRPGAVSSLGGHPVKVWRTAVAEGSGELAEPGQVLRVERDGPVVACGQGALLVREVQEAGKRAVSGADFARGKRLAGGERFAS
jgi:methionyl-tRNA formyltransferase